MNDTTHPPTIPDRATEAPVDPIVQELVQLTRELADAEKAEQARAKAAKAAKKDRQRLAAQLDARLRAVSESLPLFDPIDRPNGQAAGDEEPAAAHKGRRRRRA